jgi:signal transduction histidine kinase
MKGGIAGGEAPRGYGYRSTVTCHGSPPEWLSHPRQDVLDVLLAAAITVMVLVDLSSAADASGVRPTDVWAVLLSLLQTVPLAFRRRAPLLVFLLIVTGVGVYYALGYEVTDGTLATFVGVYTVAAHENRRRSFVALGVLAVAMTWYWVFRAEPFDPTTPIWIGILAVLSWSLGEYVKARRAYTSEVETLAGQLEQAREFEARQAVWQERARLARELHDLIGHTVNLMVVQAGAGRRTLASDPSGAERAFQTIETTGREALDELDRLLGVLQTPDDEPYPPALPGLDQVRALADRFQNSGLAVQVSIEGEQVPLPRSLDQSAYRIIQEALTNALRHAGGAMAHVAVRYRDNQLELEIADDGHQNLKAQKHASGGRGLIGIRERVAMFGGDLDAGQRPGGGFVVRCRFPLAAGRSS